MNSPPTGREKGGAEIALQFDEVIVIRAEDSREGRLRWREREAIKFVFFARLWRRGEPINKTGDEGQRNVGRKKERAISL